MAGLFCSRSRPYIKDMSKSSQIPFERGSPQWWDEVEVRPLEKVLGSEEIRKLVAEALERAQRSARRIKS